VCSEREEAMAEKAIMKKAIVMMGILWNMAVLLATGFVGFIFLFFKFAFEMVWLANPSYSDRRFFEHTPREDKFKGNSSLVWCFYPDCSAEEGEVLEVDEMCSFVGRKGRKVWTWTVLCRGTRQVVACVVGDRSEETCRKLWKAIPETYRGSYSYSDFWHAYALVFPKEEHQ